MKTSTMLSIVATVSLLFVGARAPYTIARAEGPTVTILQAPAGSADVVVDWDASDPQGFVLNLYESQLVSVAGSLMSLQQIAPPATVDTHRVGLPAPGDTLFFIARALAIASTGETSDTTNSPSNILVAPFDQPGAPSNVSTIVIP